MASTPVVPQTKAVAWWKGLLVASAGAGAGFALVAAGILGVTLWHKGHSLPNPSPARPGNSNGGRPQIEQRPETGGPTLGFAQIKDVSPVMDGDALHEEWKLEKKLPGNQFVKDKRAFHEASLMHDFLEGFKESGECKGIAFYMTEKKLPDFAVQITVNFHDTANMEQEWVWTLSEQKVKATGTKPAGLGIQSTAKLTARDVCMTVWEDVDPNHYKKPGGKIE